MTQITGHAEFCELFLDDVVGAQGEPPRRARRRLEDRHAHARARARHRRPAAPGEAAHVAGPRGARGRATRAGRSADPRGPGGPGGPGASAHRCRGPAPPRLQDGRGVPQRRGRRPGLLQRQAAHGRGRAARSPPRRSRCWDRRCSTPTRWRAPRTTSGRRRTCTRVRQVSTAGRGRSSATSSPTASSSCPRSRQWTSN